MKISEVDVTGALADAEKLVEKDKSVSPHIRAVVKVLIVIIKLFIDKFKLNSSTSSIPPSKDPTRQRGSKRKTKGIKRKPGGQKGHEGTTLQKVENPDHIEPIVVDRRTIPRGTYTDIGFDGRQVIDIKISRHVTEYRAQILRDADGNHYVANFPPGVTQVVQYGNGIKAQSVYMSQQQLIPYDRVRDYFADQCDIPVSPGSIFNFNKQTYELLEKYESLLVQHMINRPLLHADETGINVNGKLLWLHTVCDDQFTMFFPHEKRGADGMKAMGILEHFQGTLCHDHWKSYFRFECAHALCNAHHLRELERAREQDDQCWAKQMQDLLFEINEVTTKAGGCLIPCRLDARVYRDTLLVGVVEDSASVVPVRDEGLDPDALDAVVDDLAALDDRLSWYPGLLEELPDQLLVRDPGELFDLRDALQEFPDPADIPRREAGGPEQRDQ